MPYWWEAYKPVTGELSTCRARPHASSLSARAMPACPAPSSLRMPGIDAACWRRPSSAPAPARATAAASAAASTSARVSPARARQPRSRGAEDHPGLGPRRLQPGRDADRARKDRLLLGEERPLRRRLDAARTTPTRSSRVATPKRQCRARAPTWCRASASARRWRRTITTAAWWWSARPSSIRRSTTGDCWMRRAARNDHALRQGGGEDHHASGQGLAASRPRAATSRPATS